MVWSKEKIIAKRTGPKLFKMVRKKNVEADLRAVQEVDQADLEQ